MEKVNQIPYTESLAQICMLATYANQSLKETESIPLHLLLNNTTLSNCKTIYFRNPERKIIADSPAAWIESLRAAGCKEVRIKYSQLMLAHKGDDAEFNNSWMLETIHDDHCNYWVNKWNPVDSPEEGVTRWNVNYQITSTTKPDTDPVWDNRTAKEKLTTAFEQAVTASKEAGDQPGVNQLQEAATFLSTPNPEEDAEYADMIPLHVYPQIAQQILYAAIALGRYNKNKPENSELHQTLCEAITSAVNNPDYDFVPEQENGQHSQTWKTDIIREKLTLIQNLLLSPLTRMGYGPSTGLWKKCTISSNSTQLRAGALLEMADGKLEPLGRIDVNISQIFLQIKAEMYAQAPHEGAWLTCDYTFESQDIEQAELTFEYDHPENVPGGIDNKSLIAEFKKFPRSKEFTPEAWQQLLDEKIVYLPQPNDPIVKKELAVKAKSRREILSYIEDLRKCLAKDPEHLLHMADRIALYQQIKDSATVNKIFFECAKKVFPAWQEQYPGERNILQVLHQINDYLYPDTESGEENEEPDFDKMYDNYLPFVHTDSGAAGLAGCTVLTTALSIHMEAEEALAREDYNYEDDTYFDYNDWLPDYYGFLTYKLNSKNNDYEAILQRNQEYWEWYLDMAIRLIENAQVPLLELPELPEPVEYPEETFHRTQTLTDEMQSWVMDIWDDLAGFDLSGYEGCIVLTDTVPYTDTTIYLVKDGEPIEANLSLNLNDIFIRIKKEMYEQAPHEGAWISCTTVFSLKRRVLKSISFNYGDRDTREDYDVSPEYLIKEFRKYPRSWEFTPRWWMVYLGKTDKFLPLPQDYKEVLTPPEQKEEKAGISPEEIISYIQELKQSVRENRAGTLPLAARMWLYRQIGDPVLINKIFLACAIKAYPHWRDSYPNDTILPALLQKAHTYLYNQTDEERDSSWFSVRQYIDYAEEETGATGYAGWATIRLIGSLIYEAVKILHPEGYNKEDDTELEPELWLPDYCVYRAILEKQSEENKHPENPENNRTFWLWLLETTAILVKYPERVILEAPAIPELTPEKSFERKQTEYSFQIRQKFLEIRLALKKDLEANKITGWHQATLTLNTVPNNQIGIIFSKMNGEAESPQLSPATYPNLFTCLEAGKVIEIKEEMYKLAPFEGAWCQCRFICVLYQDNVKNMEFNYDQREFHGFRVKPTYIREEFKKYPRSQAFTPNWWQASLNKNTVYLDPPAENAGEKFSQIRRQYGIKDKDRAEILELYKAVRDKNLTVDNGDTLLHVAAEQAHHEAIAHLLESGIRANSKNKSEQTALHTLANISHSYPMKIKPEDIIKSAELLIDARIIPLLRNKQGWTCYHTAAHARNLPFLKALLQKGAKLDMMDNEGRTLLHLIPAEIMRREIESLKYAKSDEQKEYVVHVVEDSYRLCRELMAYGLDPQKKDNRNKSPFDIAVEYNLKKLSALFDGEDPESPEGRLKVAAGGKTIHQAAATGDVEAVEALLQLGSDPNEVFTEYEYKNMTPLAVAALEGHISCIEALLKGGADPHFRSGEKGEGVMLFVINKIQDKKYYAPHKQVTSVEIMQFFLDHGLDVNKPIDNDSHTMLNYACLKGLQSIRTFLLNTGRCDVNLPDVNGRTPLMNFVQSENHKNPENELIQLLEQGADPEARDANGNTPLMCAASNRKSLFAYNMTDILFSFGYPPIDVVNNNGQTALDIAVEKGHEDLVKLLLSKM